LPIRRFATDNNEKKSQSSGSSGLNYAALAGIVVVVAVAGTLYIFRQDTGELTIVKKPLNYQEVYNAIANLLDSNPEYDDGSYGPVLVRLAWHAAGTYDKITNTGGSNGATMRFNPESHHGANSGLATARDLLEKVKKQYPDISYSDLWSLAGVVAIQEMGGPVIKWRPGRVDAVGEQTCTPDGRLPDASQGQDHIRNIFYRMGFNDQEIVALAGAHALGRCHTNRSGYDGPWTRSPTAFTNDYFKRLLEERWVEKKWTGPKQFVDKATAGLMMLPADIAFIKDRAFKKYVDLYAKDEKKFFDDFASAFQKLEELGVPFKGDEPALSFKPTA
jgi:cytochrome c peroxidase